MNKYLLILTLVLASFSVSSQSDGWIIQLGDSANAVKFCKKNNLILVDALSTSRNVYLVDTALDKNKFKEILQNSVEVISFQENKRVESRATPNDDLFEQQWNMEIINAVQAWDVSTGGLTSNGKEIVIAVIDEGFDIEHEDLSVNLWSNPAEIANNAIDDDFNNYIDDVNGANVQNNSGTHVAVRHGTAVAGILGASGNNSVGVAGLNWDVKIMVLSGVNFVANIIESYEYVYNQRKLYNDSNGQEGAYVVVSNLSLGLANAFAEDHPIWCGMYDMLGQEGVINVAATVNSGVDVAVAGDMPSTCLNDHLIMVTNSTIDDELDSGAGFSNTLIDLGAPGDVIALDVNNNYRSFEGTSSSCPHVAGTVGLLYSVNCEALYQSSIDNPASISLFVKDVILNNVDQLPAFANTTTSGGRLNVYNAMINMGGDICGSSVSGQLSIEMRSPNPGQGFFFFDYVTDVFTEHQVAVHGYDGKLIYKTTVVPQIFENNFLRINSEEITQGIGLPYGLYIVSIENEKEHASTKFLVID